MDLVEISAEPHELCVLAQGALSSAHFVDIPNVMIDLLQSFDALAGAVQAKIGHDRLHGTFTAGQVLGCLAKQV